MLLCPYRQYVTIALMNIHALNDYYLLDFEFNSLSAIVRTRMMFSIPHAYSPCNLVTSSCECSDWPDILRLQRAALCLQTIRSSDWHATLSPSDLVGLGWVF